MVRFNTRPLEQSGDGGAKEIKNDQVQYPTIETKWRWRGQEIKNGQVQYPTIETKWRWRGLNPRPNKEAIRFLHAYSCLRFS